MNKKNTLYSISPSDFENLIFDILISRGMNNVSWRTPGADGGRDIEGITSHRDFSGEQTVSKWFIECKRYKGSVDWPTIHPKLAYADSLRSEYLLLCTSSKFTPMAITQVEQWNLSHRSPQIRLWPGHEILMQLRQHPDLELKYGLNSGPVISGPSILSVALALSKSVSSHYSRLVFEGDNPDRMLQAAQALAELLQGRMQQMESAGKIFPRREDFLISEVDGVVFSALVNGLDGLSIIAIISYLAALSKNQITVSPISSGECEIKGGVDFSKLIERYRNTLISIALWGDMDYYDDGCVIKLRQRN
ncbi:MAG: restriction endonuclease [Pseudomonadota bacterium]